jgi:WD40 repeat protein
VLLTGGKDGMVRCWNTNTNYEQVLQLAAHQSTIYDIVYHHEANQFVSCSRDKTIKWWDANTFDALRKVDSSSGGHKFSVNRIIVQGRLLISASDDRGVLVFGA